MCSVRLGLGAVLVPLCVVFSSGCSTIKENAPDTSQLSTTTVGAATGAVLGGGLGAVMGSVSGDAGTGLVIGTLAGTAAGGLVGAAIEKQQDTLSTQNETVQKQEEQIGQNRRQIEQMRRDLSRTEARASTAKPAAQPVAAAAFPDARASFQSVTIATPQTFSRQQINRGGSRLAQPYQPSADDLARARSTDSELSDSANRYSNARISAVKSNARQSGAVAKRIDADLPPVVVPGRSTAKSVTPSGAASHPLVEPMKVIAAPSAGGSTAALPKAKQNLSTDGSANSAEESLVEEDGPDGEAALPPPAKHGDGEALATNKINKTDTALGATKAESAKTPGSKNTAVAAAPLPADKSCQEAGQEAQRGVAAASDADKLFYLRRAIRLCPTHVPFHIQVGGIYENIGRKEDAAYEFRQVLDLDPQNGEAKTRLQALEGTTTASASE